MKKSKFLSILAAATALGMTACDNDTLDPVDDLDPSLSQTASGVFVRTITNNITGSYTMKADTIYRLNGRIFVEDGATLTIEPGTIIKGAQGDNESSKALIVAQGGKLMAMGTAAKPIIMTSEQDNIEPGATTLASPNLATTQVGQWGGLIILGKAPSSLKGDALTQSIEGIPADDPKGKYGGTVASDNSGTIQYVSIRHGGTNIGEGNEINGLTLAGVGSGTIIDHIEIVANQDDGLEIFGGTVNVNDVIVWGQGDDAFDMDQEWSGTLDNFIAVLEAGSDHALELDGAEGQDEDILFTLKNGTMVGTADGDNAEMVDLRSNVKVNLENIAFVQFDGSADIELDNNKVATNWLNSDINFKNLQVIDTAGRTIDQIFVEKTRSDDPDTPEDESEDPLNVFETRAIEGIEVVDATTIGADVSEFTGWTWAAEAGELSNL